MQSVVDSLFVAGTKALIMWTWTSSYSLLRLPVMGYLAKNWWFGGGRGLIAPALQSRPFWRVVSLPGSQSMSQTGHFYTQENTGDRSGQELLDSVVKQTLNAVWGSLVLFGGRPYDGHAVSYLSLSVVKMGILGMSELICNSICKILKKSKGFFHLNWSKLPHGFLKLLSHVITWQKLLLKALCTRVHRSPVKVCQVRWECVLSTEFSLPSLKAELWCDVCAGFSLNASTW